MNIAYNVESSARFFPKRPAVCSGDVEITYSRFNELINRVATGLINFGLKSGDLIGL